MPLVESSGLRYQDAHVRNTEEETEADILELMMKKQEESSDPLHMKDPKPKLLKFQETIEQNMPLVESSGLRCQDVHVGNTMKKTRSR